MRLQPNRNYKSDDVVMTPLPLAEALVSALKPRGRILEPCSGTGAFVSALSSFGVVSSCDVENGGFGFWSERVDWIVTNPPWSQFREFLVHGMEIADHVAMLVTVNHWWTKRRVRDVRHAGFGYRELFLCDWPNKWHSTGFQLGMMHVEHGYVGDLKISTVEWSQQNDRAGESSRALRRRR
jgi:hypothetical protein